MVAFAAAGAWMGGLQGLTMGLLAAVWPQALYMMWPVLRVARGGGLDAGTRLAGSGPLPASGITNTSSTA